MSQVGIFPWSRPMPHTHQNIGQGGTVNHAHLVNVLSAQHHALPSLGELSMELGCKVYRAAAQSIPTGAWTKILFDTEAFDVGSDFAGSQYTVPSDGYYLAIVKVSFINMPANVDINIEARRNGTAFSKAGAVSGSILADDRFLICSSFEYFTTGQVITGYVYHNQGANKSLFGGLAQTYMCVLKVGV